jgi:hypothetical protein
MRQQRKALALAAALVITFANIAAVAQQTLDRTKLPTPGETPVLRVPTWTKTQLANGATLIVSERHNPHSFPSRSLLLVGLISLRRPGNVVWLR